MPGSEKVSPGEEFRPPAAATWNALIDAKDRILRGVKRVPLDRVDLPVPTDVVEVKVTASLPRGSVIELGARLITDLDPRNLVYDWVPSGPNSENFWAITRHQIAGDEIGEAQVAGVCIARVDVLDIEHRFARVVSGENVLESAGSGPVRLVQLATGTGEQELVVQLRYEPRVEVVELASLEKTGDFYGGTLKDFNPQTNTWSDVRTVWIVDAND
jgi:hypothetical protein